MTFEDARTKLLAELDVAYDALRAVAGNGKGYPEYSEAKTKFCEVLAKIGNLNKSQADAEKPAPLARPPTEKRVTRPRRPEEGF